MATVCVSSPGFNHMYLNELEKNCTPHIIKNITSKLSPRLCTDRGFGDRTLFSEQVTARALVFCPYLNFRPEPSRHLITLIYSFLLSHLLKQALCPLQNSEWFVKAFLSGNRAVESINQVKWLHCPQANAYNPRFIFPMNRVCLH